MGLAATLLPEFDHEMANTRKCLERVPEDKLDWKPHDKSMSLGEITTHMANLLSWTMLMIEQDRFACRRKFPRAQILAVTRSRASIRFAKHKRWIREGFTSLQQGVADADLIVICTPVNTLSKILKEVDRFAKPGALVMDIGSVKGKIVKAADRQ